MPEAASLSALRVLDLSRGVEGAFCTKLFAEFGADVITLEPPSGHPLRRTGPFAADRPHPETGALWLYLGTNKRSATLDIETPTGRRLFRTMVEEANIIVEDFPPGRVEELGLGFDVLHGIVRRIVLVSITPFGQTGPRANWRATNLTSFASGGQMSLTGDPDRDFVTLMIPHHQGAIDMAKALLLYGKDPQLGRLAQEIITDQQSEIQLMQLWLKQHGASSQNPTQRPGLDASKH